MNDINCGLINDLLPLYADSICSEESRKIVEEHILSCEKCRNELSKMTKNIPAPQNTDIGPIKKINRGIIERIAIVIVICFAVITAVVTGGFLLANTDVTMDYEKNNLAENVRVIEEENGSLYLVRDGAALSSSYVFFDNFGIADHAFKPYEDENGVRHITYFVTLQERAVNRISFKLGTTESKIAVERNLLWDDSFKSVVDAVYYYDDTTGQKYLLWEAK